MNDYRTGTIEADDLGLSDEFLSDECIARDQDEWDCHHSAPKCGGFRHEDRDGVRHGSCEGCRHCSPTDPEDKPRGFGIESYEDPALLAANQKIHDHIARAFGAYALHPVEPSACHGGRPYANTNGTWQMLKPERDRLWAALSVRSQLRERASDRVWDRLCDTCETHSEAKAKYVVWAKRALTIRFRDEAIAPVAR